MNKLLIKSLITLAAVLTLLAVQVGEAGAANLTSQDVAWIEALALANVPSAGLERPDLDTRTLGASGAGSYCLMVHLFLHAIYQQTQIEPGAGERIVSERASTWVAMKMSWRLNSNACSLAPLPGLHADSTRARLVLEPGPESQEVR